MTIHYETQAETLATLRISEWQLKLVRRLAQLRTGYKHAIYLDIPDEGEPVWTPVELGKIENGK